MPGPLSRTVRRAVSPSSSTATWTRGSSTSLCSTAFSTGLSTTDRAPVVANAGVRSVVDNLVENAVEHNDADDPRVHVAVELDARPPV